MNLKSIKTDGKKTLYKKLRKIEAQARSENKRPPAAAGYIRNQLKKRYGVKA